MPACFRCDGPANRIAPRWAPMSAEESVMSRGVVAWNRIECGFYGRPESCSPVEGPSAPQDPENIDLLALFAEVERDRAEYNRIAKGGADLCV